MIKLQGIHKYYRTGSQSVHVLRGVDLEIREALALSEDRPAALAQLLPGSEDHDFYRCLHAQHAGALADADEILRTWPERHGTNRPCRDRRHTNDASVPRAANCRALSRRSVSMGRDFSDDRLRLLGIRAVRLREARHAVASHVAKDGVVRPAPASKMVGAQTG